MIKKIDMENAPKVWSIEKVLDLEKLQKFGGGNSTYCDCKRLLTATTRGWYCDVCNKIIKEN